MMTHQERIRKNLYEINNTLNGRVGLPDNEAINWNKCITFHEDPDGYTLTYEWVENGRINKKAFLATINLDRLNDHVLFMLLGMRILSGTYPKGE